MYQAILKYSYDIFNCMRVWRDILTRVALRTWASLYVIILIIEVIEVPNFILEIYWWCGSNHFILMLGNYFLFRRLFFILVYWFLTTNISSLCFSLFRGLRVFPFTLKEWCSDCIFSMFMCLSWSCFLTCNNFYIIIFFCWVVWIFQFFLQHIITFITIYIGVLFGR